MSSRTCPRCGVVTDSVLPGGLCVTCHGRQDDTRQSPSVVADAPTPSYDPDAAGTLTFATPTDTTVTHGEAGADPFGVLPAGGYVYGEVLGTGGMGCVYRAVRVSTSQTVAIKKLRPERYTPSLLRRFVQEARILARVEHPNVVRLHDFVPDPGDPHIVMDFVDGCSLADRLADGKGLPAELAARLIADAARGVQAAHEAGVIHRDLKPANLLVTADGRVKVSDFGLGKVIADDDSPTLTATDTPIGGTPGYAAPEQVAEGGECDERTDVWGLGACLHACLVGKPPYPTGRANLTRVLSDPLVPPRRVNPAVPPVLDAIVCKCLEKAPAKRYQSAAAVADDLDRYLRGEPTVAKPLSWAARVWRRARLIPRAAVIAAAVAAVLTAGIVLAVVYQRPRDVLAEHKAALMKGKPVTLVPADGPPGWSKWLAGATTFAPGELRDGGVQFQTTEVSYLCLIDDPMTDSYRIEAELRHMTARPPHSRCGLFLDFDELSGPGGDTTRCVLVWEFSDFWDDSEFNEELQNAHTSFFRDVNEYQPVIGRNPGVQIRQLATHRFRPAVVEGGVWRKMAIDVDPNGISGSWWDVNVNNWVPAFHLIRAEIAAKRTTWAGELARTRRVAISIPEWTPRKPLGVYGYNGTICVKNVILLPR